MSPASRVPRVASRRRPPAHVVPSDRIYALSPGFIPSPSGRAARALRDRWSRPRPSPTRLSIRQSSTTPNPEPFAPKANATRTARALIREPSLDPGRSKTGIARHRTRSSPLTAANHPRSSFTHRRDRQGDLQGLREEDRHGRRAPLRARVRRRRLRQGFRRAIPRQARVQSRRRSRGHRVRRGRPRPLRRRRPRRGQGSEDHDPRRRRLLRLGHRPPPLQPRVRGCHRRQHVPPHLRRSARIQLPHPDQGHPRARPRLGRSLRQAHRALRGRHLRLRVPLRRVHRIRSHRVRSLRRAALGALLDDGPLPRGVHPDQQRHGHHQRVLRHQGVRPRVPPHQARHHGRVRHPEHRHRGGLHHDRAQRPHRHAPVPQAGQLLLPPLQVPRFREHAHVHQDVEDANHRPQPGCRLRSRHPGDHDGREAREQARLRRRLRHRAQPLRHPGRRGPPHDGVRQGWANPRFPQHHRHVQVHPNRVR